MNLNTAKIKEAVIDVLKVGLVPFIASSPGCGKSDIVRSIAKEFGLFLIDLRLASKDPTDINAV